MKDSAEQLTKKDTDLLQIDYPGLPTDYLDFLTQVGFGYFGEIQIYNGPVLYGDVYQNKFDLKNILLFGDDHQGYCFGFDTSNKFQLVEIDPMGSLDKLIESEFSTLIAKYFSED